jgi:hypothetical protein
MDHKPPAAAGRDSELRVAVTGRTADYWSSPSPPKDEEAPIPRSVPCTRLANLILPPHQQEAPHTEVHIPRWGIWVAAHLLESKAWALYREREKRFASFIGVGAPVVLHRQLPGMGAAKRFVIAIAAEERAPLDTLCAKLTAADIACDVMRNTFGDQ